MWHHSKAQAGQGTAGNPQNVAVGVPDPVKTSFGWLQPGTIVETVLPGFSGAHVWKVTCRDQSYALKRWPAGQPVHLSLPSIHQLMIQARRGGVTVIPEVCRTGAKETCLSFDNSFWDACSWQHGQPDPQPNESRLRSAMKLLTSLHAIWRTSNERRTASCPAIQLQHRRLLEWTTIELEWLKQQVAHHPLFRQAAVLFELHRPGALRRLAPWLNHQVALQPCLGDVWADHVLFEGDQVTGLIDFGSVRFDHPTQDLARLIGSYTQGDAVRRQLALSYYAPMTNEWEQLLMVLDDSGTIVGLGNWLRWLILEKRTVVDPHRTMARLQKLVMRLEHCFSSHR